MDTEDTEATKENEKLRVQCNGKSGVYAGRGSKVKSINAKGAKVRKGKTKGEWQSD